MRLRNPFNRQKQPSDIPPELQPYYSGASTRQRQVLWLVGLIAAVLLLGLGIAWLANRGDETPAPPDRTQSQGAEQNPQDTSEPSAPKPSEKPAETPGSGTTNNEPTETPSAETPPTALPSTGG
jgi:cytoskeletal protein RodZ